MEFVDSQPLRVHPAPVQASFLTRERLGWGLVAGLLVLAGAHLLARGPVDIHGNFSVWDFANHYSAARMWLIGADPYDRALLQATWQASGPGAVHVGFDQAWSLLPPGAFVVLSPLAALPAGWALAVWFALCVVMVWTILATALKLGNFELTSLKAWLVIAAALAAAPIQTLLAVGQFSLISITCILLCIRCAQTNRPALGGILLGLAAAIKPQLALPFGVFYLLYRNWRLAGCALATVLALNAIGIAQLQWRGHDWFAGWTWNLAHVSDPGNCNDITLSGPQRHQMISLNILTMGLVPIEQLAAPLALLLSAALIGGYAWLLRKGKLTADSLLSLSILCALGLLPIYHRSYDAALLVLPLAWALSALNGPLRRSAWLTLAALSVYLIPFDALHLMTTRLGMFQGISQTWLWNAIVAPHHAWATLGISACLIGALYKRLQQLSTASPTIEEDAAVAIAIHANERAISALARWQRDRERARRSA